MVIRRRLWTSASSTELGRSSVEMKHSEAVVIVEDVGRGFHRNVEAQVEELLHRPLGRRE